MNSQALSENDIKEELSYAYLHAICAKTGIMCARVPTKDRTSKDVMLEGYFPSDASQVETISPELRIQLKATSDVNVNAESVSFKYDLSIKNYNDLRRWDFIPHLLIILILPRNISEWLEISQDNLISRKCAYWCNLKPLPDVSNTASRRIDVYLENQVTPENINKLMFMAAKQEDIGHVLP